MHTIRNEKWRHNYEYRGNFKILSSYIAKLHKYTENWIKINFLKKYVTKTDSRSALGPTVPSGRNSEAPQCIPRQPPALVRHLTLK